MLNRTIFITTIFMGLIFTVAGCGNAKITESPVKDYRKLVDASVKELQLKTESHKSWGLGTFDRWDVDQESGKITFSNTDGKTAVASIQIIGSFNTSSNTWMWAWDNSSVEDSLKQDALKLKEYGKEHGIEKLTEGIWEGTETEAWEMVALASKLYNAQGAYRGSAGSTLIFMTFGEVELKNRFK